MQQQNFETLRQAFYQYRSGKLPGNTGIMFHFEVPVERSDDSLLSIW